VCVCLCVCVCIYVLPGAREVLVDSIELLESGSLDQRKKSLESRLAHIKLQKLDNKIKTTRTSIALALLNVSSSSGTSTKVLVRIQILVLIRKIKTTRFDY
jgi:hypothetical protein